MMFTLHHTAAFMHKRMLLLSKVSVLVLNAIIQPKLFKSKNFKQKSRLTRVRHEPKKL
jgi:hypothetical protein